jgi:hypothetical protein
MYGTSQYAGGCSGSGCSPVGYSKLESIASEGHQSIIQQNDSDFTYRPALSSPVNYSISAINAPSYSFSPASPMTNSFSYSPINTTSSSSYKNNPLTYNLFQPQANYNFIPDNFLQPGNWGMFVGKAEEIREHIEQAFELMFHEAFPKDVKVSVLDEEKFRKLAPHPGTLGLALNRRKQGLMSEIFVKNDFLARVLLTVGHELGHVLTEQLTNAQDEEAKAYAFSLAWMRVIKENDIAGLKNAIVTERPAENGIHNIAFFFVEKLMKKGRKVGDIYQELIHRNLSCRKSEMPICA